MTNGMDTALNAPALRRSSFFWPMRLMAKPQREAMFELYRFCRAVDDIADSQVSQAEKQHGLDRWQHELNAIYAGTSQNTLADAIQRYGLKQEYFDAIIEGMRMDVDGRMVRPTLATLARYSYCVAGCVGLLALPIFGCRMPQSTQLAIELGYALQYTNILRDLLEDIELHRIYLPAEWLAEAGLGDITPQQVPQSLAALKPVMAKLSASADTHYQRVAALVTSEDAANLSPALMMRDAYRMLWQQMEQDGWSHADAYRIRGYQRAMLLGKMLWRQVA